MHLWTIALVSILVVVSSYTMRVVPVSLILAVILCAVLEMLVRRLYLRHPFKMPWSGLITGLIIGSVAPVNVPLALVAVAAAIAILSKFFIQYKSSNIFNPATLGLIIALPLFALGDEWWVASNYNIYGIAVTLTPILIILAYEAKRLPAALSFSGVSFLIALLVSGVHLTSASSVLAVLFSINYFFAFVMLIEPKTSPNNRYAQLAYGSGLALLYLAFVYLRLSYPLLALLLIGNILYLVYRKFGGR